MDQVKLYLGLALKNQFWILCGVFPCSAWEAGLWLRQSRRDTKENAAEIETAFKTAETISGKGVKPTANSKPAIQRGHQARDGEDHRSARRER